MEKPSWLGGSAAKRGRKAAAPVPCRGQGCNACMTPAATSGGHLRAMGIKQDFIASGTVPNDTECLPSLNVNILPEVKQGHLQMQGRLMSRYVTLELR